MTHRNMLPRWMAALSVLALGGLLLSGPVRADDPVPDGQEPGVEILNRGPIHEGFGQPVHREPRQGPSISKAPPAALEELPPDQKPEGDDIVWLPGYWHYDDEREDFIWVSGFWRRLPPGRSWVPGYWHEADGGHRWVSGFWAAEGTTELEYLPRPPASVEAGPSTPQPTDEHQWVPGHWRWNDGAYLWQPGYWTEMEPGWVWSPAQYVDTPGGCVYVDGFWDYSIRRRGLLFAPAYFGVGFGFGRPWRPWACWDSDFLIDHLFVNVGWGGYWFGDFYGAGWWGRGFRPWFGFHAMTGNFCPIFSYHRFWFARTNPNWAWQCQNHFHRNWTNPQMRPPATFADQQRNWSGLRGDELTRARDRSPIKPVGDMGNRWARDPQATMRMRQIPDSERLAAAQRARDIAAGRSLYRSHACSRSTATASSGCNRRRSWHHAADQPAGCGACPHAAGSSRRSSADPGHAEPNSAVATARSASAHRRHRFGRCPTPSGSGSGPGCW
ncbi:MAG TPA: hypothetical protein PKC45_15710 [Gemmatales bacterium]|nr:hypothetical protein [Gemmatales bacterium]